MFGNTMKLGLGAAMVFGAVNAQTAPGFPIEADQQLEVVFGNDTVSPGGELIPRGETSSPPNISSPTWYADERGPGPATLLMVDLDVPRNGTRVQLLHWLATNIRLSTTFSPTTNISSAFLSVPPQNPVPYLQPSPPVGDIPHSYSFVLFAQPENFTIPDIYADLADNRVGFDVASFVRDVGLSRVLAGNWITVQNVSGEATQTFPPARPSETAGGNASETTGTAEFSGEAARVGRGAGVLGWVGVGAAVLVGGIMVGL